ncbi:hypothetical protein [Parvularcula sp. LCG005]|uniref:hypothetical protein n=1 Tax=Parvularcula sp. LCG005 TaxID=3078805 RepID=UPI0029433610|nr:hypothetical protein [Parvularcula sp. LCG005]WOI52915.1 hypothetical protein RUI03_12230 [Parvularcula sp. LCG005]
MDIEHLTGAAKSVLGQTKVAIGQMLTRDDMIKQGRRDIAEARVRQAVGDARVAIRRRAIKRQS